MSTAVLRTSAQPRFRKSPAIFKGLCLWNSAAESDIASVKTLSWDTGAPDHTAAQGSVYIRLDASDSESVFYRNTDGAATWETMIGSEITDFLAAANAWTGNQTHSGTETFSNAAGVTTNVITERTAAAGVTIDSLLIKDGAVDLNGVAGALILDADADTFIGASTDDEIDVTVSGAADFKILANILRCLAGSVVETDTINETTAASGVTIDSCLVKDGQVQGASPLKADTISEFGAGNGVTIDGAKVLDGHIVDSVGFYDAVAPTKIVRLDAGAVTAGQTRVLAMPDADVTLGAYAPTLLNVADEAAFKAATNLEAGTDYNAYDAGLASLVSADAAAGLPYVTAGNTWASLAGFSADHFVKATVAAADGAGGVNTSLVSVQLNRFDGSTAIASARQVLLIINATQYSDAAGPTNASVSLGTVTSGSIVATVVAGSIYLIETSAAGLFGCTMTETDDGTLYLNVKSPMGGVSDLAKTCLVLGSNSDSAVFSA